MDFAFFAVHFGYSRGDYDELTETEKVLIMHEYEKKTVADTTLLRNAVLNAVGNALRKKGASFRHLWKKKAQEKRDIKKDIKEITKIEEKEKGWLDRVYAAAGIKRRRK